MKTDDLIERLARDATVVAPLPAPGMRTVLWMVWAALYLVIVAIVMRLTVSAGGVMVTPLYLMQQGAALLTGIAAALAACESVVPGVPRRAWKLAFVSASAWLFGVVWGVVADARTVGTIGLTSQTDWPCVVSMTLGGLVIGGPLVLMLRRGAPLTPRSTAFLIGLAALSVANIEACLTRPHPFAATVLVWHGMTVGAAALACAVIGRHWFRWPSRQV
jgi:hypothetical protein